jgi:hypothetical protein
MGLFSGFISELKEFYNQLYAEHGDLSISRVFRLGLQEELIGTQGARRVVTGMFLALLCGASTDLLLGIFVERINTAAAKIIFNFTYNFAVKNPIGHASMNLVFILILATIVIFRAFGTQKFHEKLYKEHVEPNFFNFNLMKGLCILIGAYRSELDPLVPQVPLKVPLKESKLGCEMPEEQAWDASFFKQSESEQQSEQPESNSDMYFSDKEIWQ